MTGQRYLLFLMALSHPQASASAFELLPYLSVMELKGGFHSTRKHYKKRISTVHSLTNTAESFGFPMDTSAKLC